MPMEKSGRDCLSFGWIFFLSDVILLINVLAIILGCPK